MKTIHIITDPNGAHIETCVEYNSSLELLLLISDMIHNFTKMNFSIEDDNEAKNWSFWVTTQEGDAIMYIYIV